MIKCKFRPFVATIFTLSVLISCKSSAQNFGVEHCLLQVDNVNVEPDADVVIGAILPIHKPGEGIYGCGLPTPDGVQVYEAFRWAINVLNSNSGLISDAEGSSGSLIPGVKIGLKVYDNCGHQASAVEHLTTLFPVLRSGPTVCDQDHNNSTLIIGVVDMSDVAKQPKVSEAMRDYLIPSIELSMTTLVPPERMAQVLLKAAEDLKWSNIVVLHEEEVYSISVVKQLIQNAFSKELCIANIYTIPPAHLNAQTNGQDMRPLRRILRTVTDSLSDETAVIVVTSGGDQAERILQVMSEAPETVTRLQWLFSWIPPSAALTNLGSALSHDTIYSIAPYPDKLMQFEEHWSQLSQRASVGNTQDRWYLEHLMSVKDCKLSEDTSRIFKHLPLCSDRKVSESPLDVLLRTSRIVPALTSVFTFAAAFHKAWEYKCHGSPGICTELRSMTRREFANQFLDPVEFLLGEDDLEASGRSPRHADPEKLEGSKLCLTRYEYENTTGIRYKQLIVYDGQGSHVLDRTFKSLPSQCYESGCRGCVRPRQSRLDDDLLMVENDLSDQDLDLDSDVDITIPVLLPLHKAGHSPLECGSDIDPEAVRVLEAALWTVDRINEDRGFLSGAKLGIAVLDTCSSALLATQKLTSFVVKQDLPVTSAMAVVSGAGSAETLAAHRVLRPLNITTISTSDVSPHLANDVSLGLDNHLLQISLPVTNQMQAVLDVFEHFGWQFITAVYEEDPIHKNNFAKFANLAKNRDLCIGDKIPIHNSVMTDKEVDTAVQAVVEAKSKGSRVVVFWIGESVARRLLTGLGRFMEAKVLSAGELVLVSFGSWMESIDVVHGLQSVVLGSVFVKQEQDDVPEFSTYFRRLSPGTNFRNPWFEKLREQDAMHNQMMKRSGQVISSVEATSSSSSAMIQAIVSVATGLASLREKFCQVEFGICVDLVRQPHLQELVGESILSAESPQLDHPGRLFKFSPEGYGELPVDIYNVKRLNGSTVLHNQKVASHDGQLILLKDIVAYTPQGEVPVSSVSSTCQKDCFHCQSSSRSHLIIPSSQDLYIAVAMGIHEPTKNPLACGPLKPTRGFQNFEALLWALDKMNLNQDVLPGIDLGLIVFDTCGSKEKATMDVSNFLTGNLKSTSPDNVVGFLVDDGGAIVQPVVDLTSQLDMVTLASGSADSEDTKKHPNLLTMDFPNRLLAASLVSILRNFHWNYVSVVYADDGPQSTLNADVFEEFQKQAEEKDIQLALVEKVSQDEDVASAMSIIAHRLKIKQNAGARVVVLLMPSHLKENLLAAVKQLQDKGRVQAGDFVWVSQDALEPFQMYPELSIGSLVVKSSPGNMPDFKEYFTSLSLKNNTRNPWLKEYWEQVFNCQGSACSTSNYDTLRQVGFIQDKSVSNTVNSFLALAYGLDSLRRQMCPDFNQGLCAAMKNKALIREQLFQFIKQTRFQGADGKLIKFGNNNYVERKLDIYNFREILGNVQAFVAVGQFDEANGLYLNSSRTKGSGRLGHQVPLTELSSACNDTDTCRKTEKNSLTTSQHFMKIPSNHEFVVGVMMTVHQPGSNFFTCSNVVEDSSFQNLVALNYALEMVNRNATILPEIKLGALVFDHCGRRQKAEEQIFSFIASDGSLPFKKASLNSRAMVAALTYDNLVAEDLSPLFESMLIPQVANPAKLAGEEWGQSSLYPEDRYPNEEAKVVADLLHGFDWKFVNVIHEDSKSGRNLFWNFIESAKARKICVAQSLLVKPGMSSDELIDLIEGGIESDSRVVVMLLEEPHLTKILELVSKTALFEDYIWIGLESKEHGRNASCLVQDADVDIFLVRPETREVPGFMEYHNSFDLKNHQPIPDSWFEEFWQHHFHCHLTSSPASLTQYPNPCNGSESLHHDTLIQNPFVYHTVNSVRTIAESLHDYLRRYCMHGDAATNLDDCGEDARQIFWREIRKMMKAPPLHCVDGDCGPLKVSAAYQIYQMQRTESCHVYQPVGLWKDDLLILNLNDVSFTFGVKRESMCRQNCQKCFDQLTMEPEELLAPKPPLYTNFRTLWGVIISALSVLGVLLVIICTTYFLISFQITVGTTVLGYMILFGLFLLYAINFAFILSPTEGTCGIRRFGLGLSYAIIFSGMLVKVMNIWRTMSCYYDKQFHDDSYHPTSPATLLVMAVGLVIIQIILSAAWLILIPPTTGILEDEWRCHPATTFEDELVISLVYVMLMLVLTMLFSVLTWRSQDNNRESRWILTCCILISLVWIAWTVLSTQVLHRYRDLTISAANLTCASIVMLCMYLRKVYIFNKLTKDQEIRCEMEQSKMSMPNMYGTLSRTTQNMGLSYPGPLVALSGKLYGTERTTCSRTALIGQNSDDGTSDSGSGSVQVQATDLYPMDMYDGGSQFQPSSLKLTGSSRTMDECGTISVRM